MLIFFAQVWPKGGHLGSRCYHVHYALRIPAVCQVMAAFGHVFSPLTNSCFSMSNNQEELFQTILSGHYEFPRPYWNHISSAAKVSEIFYGDNAIKCFFSGLDSRDAAIGCR